MDITNYKQQFCVFTDLIENMKNIVQDNVKCYQTDAIIDIETISRAIQWNMLPTEAYWLTRRSGTQFGFADERMATSNLYAYVLNNENSVLLGREKENCYRIDFKTGKVSELEPDNFINIVKKLGSDA